MGQPAEVPLEAQPEEAQLGAQPAEVRSLLGTCWLLCRLIGTDLVQAGQRCMYLMLMHDNYISMSWRCLHVPQRLRRLPCWGFARPHHHTGRVAGSSGSSSGGGSTGGSTGSGSTGSGAIGGGSTTGGGSGAAFLLLRVPCAHRYMEAATI